MFGFASERRSTRPPRRADELADIVLQDWRGDDVRLGNLWRERPALLVFLRHYGWTYCREHAVQLHRARQEFEAAGVRLAVIGMGTPANAEHFRQTQGVDLDLLVDTRRQAYNAAGTKVGTANEVMGPRRVVDGLRRGLRAGVRQGRTIGHPAQLGGVMIVLPDGSVPYTHLAEHSGDNASNEELLEAARSAAAGG